MIFPLLARHAAAGEHVRLGSDLSLGLRLVLFVGIPASAGLFLMAEPIARLLFQHRNFTAADTPRAAAMIAWYSVGVWAYCAGPVLIRGYYALGDRITPLRIGIAAVALNFVLNLSLIWRLAEVGLAVSTAIAATVQVALLAICFSRSRIVLEWPRIAGTCGRTVLATAAMIVVTWQSLRLVPVGELPGNSLVRVLFPIAAAIAAYLAAFRLLGGPELRMLLGRHPESSTGDELAAGDDLQADGARCSPTPLSAPL